HVMAAKRLIEKGWKVEVGDKIGYVIVKGSGKISARAYPYNLVKPEDIDANYYIDHQVIPASLRILEYFGVTEKQLKVVGRGIRSLFDFAKK
ncbi:MAG TPA: DNA polymerase II, partial [Acidilobales archaeon]|nr:DNA polymerase II [Acidilobales archaeon]